MSCLWWVYGALSKFLHKNSSVTDPHNFFFRIRDSENVNMDPDAGTVIKLRNLQLAKFKLPNK